VLSWRLRPSRAVEIFVASGLSTVLSVICYTEFAVEIPVAGGSFAYLRVQLGDAAAFVAAANLTLESVISTAAVAQSWTSSCCTGVVRGGAGALLQPRPSMYTVADAG
jgi:APA family basic amino acid/polyamine antiporter